MLMRRNVAAGMGPMNKGNIVERLCSDLIAKNRDINGLLYFTFLDAIVVLVLTRLVYNQTAKVPGKVNFDPNRSARKNWHRIEA